MAQPLPQASARQAKPAFQVLVLGAGSHAGKSLLAAGLCRILADRGWKVAPFKAQNMALNSAVADDGAEIGRAQWLQARAARVRSEARMNPVLLKPLRGQGSQVVLNGRAQGIMSTTAYFRFWPKAAKAAKAAYQGLAQEHAALVLEGAGSPAEVNLAHRDLANLEAARFSGAPWILVVDIERGGSFASVVGTLALVPAWLRRRFLGVVFNKFRGDPGLMGSGLRWLKRRGIPCLGILPYLDGLDLDEEDSLGLPSLSKTRLRRGKPLRIQAIRHRHIANFDDLQVLARHPSIDLQWVKPGSQRPCPDLVILPGSKDSLADLAVLQESGEAGRLKRWHAQGAWLLGLCGGFQMLGTGIGDPGGSDSGRRGQAQGLGLLDVRTRMGRDKVLASRDLSLSSAWGPLRLKGYEIHHGRTQLGPRARAFAKDAGQAWLVCDPGRRVWGSYLHGLLDQAAFADLFLGRVARARSRRFASLGQGREQRREQSLDRWAAHLLAHLDLRFLPEPTLA